MDQVIVFLTPLATEGAPMLLDPSPPRLSEFDQQVYWAVVPPGHYLRKVLLVVPWNDFYALLAPFYVRDMGRPAEDPVLMLKLEYLRYHHNLSDREVIARAETDLAFRYFLQLPLRWKLPDPSSLCIFRGRLGAKGFRQVFNQVVRTAREHGVVKDRLRIKDATHVIGNMAVPTALALVAQTRDKLLAAAEPFAPLLVEGERVNLEMLRASIDARKVEERLAARVVQLREMLVWADALTLPEDAGPAETNRAWQTFLAQRDLAHKILADQEHPEAGDKLRSTTDPDARRGKHGTWYDGYLMDLSMDADSEIITGVNVLPANGDEAADAVELIRQEEAAHGNDVQAISIDGAGFNGPLLRALQDPEGPAVDVYVPPKKEPETQLFTPDDFTQDAEQAQVTCPAGETSSYRQRDHGWIYRFRRAQCEGCALVSQCMTHPPQGTFGKTVRKNDYQAEYRQARQKATTEAYAQVRREHPKVERKLGEVMNRHGGRRARYRGSGKVLTQQLMACAATNIKRLVRLGCAPNVVISCPA